MKQAGWPFVLRDNQVNAAIVIKIANGCATLLSVNSDTTLLPRHSVKIPQPVALEP